MQFESSHQPNLNSMLTVNCFETTKVKKKRPGMALFKNETKETQGEQKD